MMKKFYHCFVILIMIFSFVFLLIGCSGIGLPDTDANLTDEEKIEDVINNFFLALSDQNWSKVQSYCVYGSEIYNKLVEFEETWSDGVIVIEECGGGSFYVDDINYIVDIGAININSEYAEAYVYLITNLIFGNNIIEENYEEGWFLLQRINNDWKLYDSRETM